MRFGLVAVNLRSGKGIFVPNAVPIVISVSRRCRNLRLVFKSFMFRVCPFRRGAVAGARVNNSRILVASGSIPGVDALWFLGVFPGIVLKEEKKIGKKSTSTQGSRVITDPSTIEVVLLAQSR